MQNATLSLIRAGTLGANISKCDVCALLLWLLLNVNDTSNNQSMHSLGPAGTQLLIHENSWPSVMQCASWCLACDHTYIATHGPVKGIFVANYCKLHNPCILAIRPSQVSWISNRCGVACAKWICKQWFLLVSILLELIHVYLQPLWITVLGVAACVKRLQ